jgi:hypothetical protein
MIRILYLAALVLAFYILKSLYSFGGVTALIAGGIAIGILVIIFRIIESKKSFYVSANGDDNNSGKTGKKAFKTLKKALRELQDSRRSKITIIGTIGVSSEEPGEWDSDKHETQWDGENIFDIYYCLKRNITISGKANAVEKEKARLSGLGATRSIAKIYGNSWGSYVQFENIEMSGLQPTPTKKQREEFVNSCLSSPDAYKHLEVGDVEDGCSCLEIESNVVLGEGTKITNDKGYGIMVYGGSLILDGGEISGNKSVGVLITEKSDFTMRNGVIKKNRAGVIVGEKSGFAMTGGEISENTRGGIFTMKDGFAVNKGGIIRGNGTDEIEKLESHLEE